MLKEKRQRLEKKGWKLGTTEEFLELSPDESADIDLKLRLEQTLHRQRKELHHPGRRAGSLASQVRRLTALPDQHR